MCQHRFQVRSIDHICREHRAAAASVKDTYLPWVCLSQRRSTTAITPTKVHPCHNNIHCHWVQRLAHGKRCRTSQERYRPRLRSEIARSDLDVIRMNWRCNVPGSTTVCAMHGVLHGAQASCGKTPSAVVYKQQHHLSRTTLHVPLCSRFAPPRCNRLRTNTSARSKQGVPRETHLAIPD